MGDLPKFKYVESGVWRKDRRPHAARDETIQLLTTASAVWRSGTVLDEQVLDVESQTLVALLRDSAVK